MANAAAWRNNHPLRDIKRTDKVTGLSSLQTVSSQTGAKKSRSGRRVWPLAALIGVLTAALVMAAPAPSRAQDVTPTPSPTVPPPPPGTDYYGINFIQPRQPWLAIGFNSGARVVRWQFNWRDIEPDPGNWTWGTTDHQIAAWSDAGLKIHAILHNPPDFALARPGALDPSNLDGPWDGAGSSFAKYCHQFAAHYQGRIASYEVWNEPDLSQYWSGSADEYYRLLKGCYQGIRAADPATPIAMAGVAFTGNKPFFEAFIRTAARDPDGPAHDYFFDVAAVHMYADPELIYQNTQIVREVMSRYRMGSKPIWITETNVPLWGRNGAIGTPTRGFASLDEASWYVLQAASNAIAAGADKLMFFRLADDNMTGEAWGLVEANAAPRPAYRALQVASGVLHDITQAKRNVIDGDVVVTEMRRKDGARIVSAYVRTGRAATVTVPAETSAAALINSTGGYTPILADSTGNYSIHVPAAPGRNFNRVYDYVVGGPVMILVENDREGPATTIKVEAMPTDNLRVLVLWNGDDGQFGTGVAKYNVEVSDNGVDWKPWLTDTTETEGIYDISKGGSFGFRARAVDKVGNVGSYSTPTVATLKLVGTLSGQVIDLRGQSVPSARIQLSDGSLHDADANGWVHIELPPGAAQVTHIDGGIQGEASTQAQVSLILGKETTATWLVLPKNLIANSNFKNSLDGWEVSSPEDARQAQSSETPPQPVLQLSGQRRPWGPPAASITLTIPPEFGGAVLDFAYRMPVQGNTLRLRAIAPNGQSILWQTDTLTRQRTRVVLDMSRLAGRKVTLRFELWGPKGAAKGVAEIDDILLGNVPIRPTATPTP